MRMDGDQKEKYVENKIIDIESVILPQKLVSVGTFLPYEHTLNHVCSIFYR